MNKILVIEDEQIIRDALTKLLQRNDYEVTTTDSVEGATALNLSDFQLIISDIRLPGVPGTEIIQLATPTPVIMMTSYAGVESAVKAMRMGATDYISKPFNHEEMLIVIDRALRERRDQKSREALQKDLSTIYPVDEMIGKSEKME